MESPLARVVPRRSRAIVPRLPDFLIRVTQNDAILANNRAFLVREDKYEKFSRNFVAAAMA
jgi:hypothetical protein